MKKFTLILSLMVAMVTTAMAQKAHQRISHEGWVVTALNQSGTSGNEGGVSFIQDDNASTFYHSDWGSNYDGRSGKKGGDGIQAFMVELPEVKTDISLITYKGRSDNNTSGWATKVRVYVYETLPTGWPEGGLSSLSYDAKEALLAKTNEALGTPAFNNDNQQWENNRTTKLVEFETPQTGKYVLFVMDSGNDQWLTCADFQIYQYTKYDAIIPSVAYKLQVTNAAATGTLYIDTHTGAGDTAGNTVCIDETAVETYFIWNNEGDGWLISTNEAGDGNFLKVNKWCANTQSAEGSYWEIFVNDDSSISLLQGLYDGGNTNSRCFLGGDFISNAEVVKLFTDNEKGKAVNIKPVNASADPVIVKYIYKYNNETKYEEEISTFIGEEYPEPSQLLPYGVSVNTETIPTGAIVKADVEEGVATKEITLNLVLPFEPAETAESISKWYYMQMHWNNQKYINANGTSIEWKNTSIDSENIDKYTWGFVGNPFDGFKIVNYWAYNEENNNNTTLTWNSGTSLGAFNSATEFPIVHTSWETAPATSFCMKIPGTNNYLNAQGTGVASWGSTDAGSTIWLTERDLSGATELQALIDAVKGKYTEGETVGYIVSLTDLNTAIADAETAVTNKTGCVEAMTALQNAQAALETIQPTEGAFYYIASAMPSTDGRSGQKMYVNNDGAMLFQNAATLANVFQFVPAGDNRFYLYNVERGTYLNTNKGHAAGQAEAKGTEGTVKVAIANMGRANVVSIIPNGGAMLHAQASGSQVVAWNNTDNAGASAWIISEVEDITALSHELAVGEAGYATLCLGYNATIPAIEGKDNGVFVVSELVDGKFASMKEVEGVLPANTAVIVKATTGTYDFKYATTGEPAKIEANELKGTTINKNITEDAYVLGIVDKEVGLYTATKNQQDGASWKNNAFKAYLPAPADANGIASYSFSFDWNGTTGIENIEDAVEKNAVESIYDITGRKINSITVPGIYIINGKKTFVK